LEGLGVMGFAELLFQLGVSYSSEEGRKIGEEVMKFVNDEAKKASCQLAKTRGVFLNFKKSMYDTGKKEDMVRNSTRTTISPTGSISVIAGCSSSIEPLFALAYTKTVFGNKELLEVNPYFKAVLKKKGLYSDKLMQHIAKKGTLDGVSLPDEIKQVFITATQISPEDHIKMQAVFQQYVDNGVSKTLSLPYFL